MRRPVALAIVVGVTLAMLVQAGPAPVAAQSAEGLCRLLTTKEVRKALGKGKWQIADDGDAPDACYMHNGRLDDRSRALSVRLLPSDEENQAEFRDGLLAEGGYPMRFADHPAVLTPRGAISIFFPDPWDILQLSPVGYEGVDVSEGMMALAELAAARYLPAAAPPSTGPGASPATGGPVGPCGLMTTDEISAVVGEPMSMGERSDPERCAYQGTSGTSFDVLIEVASDPATSLADERRLLTPDATDTQVGGFPALLSVDPDTRSESLFVYPSDAVQVAFLLQTPTGDDLHDRLVALAELGMARAVERGLPVASGAPATPEPSVATGLCVILTTDEASAALGGAAVTSTMPGPDGCGYIASEGYVTLQVWRGDRAAEIHQGLAMFPDTFEVAGMVAAQQDMSDASKGTAASDLYALPNDSTAVEVFVTAPDDVDVHANARALLELIAPRLAPYVAP